MLMYYLGLALRSLRRSPVRTGLMVLAIGLGIGASMTMITVLHVMTDDPLPGRSAHLYTPHLDPLPRDYHRGENSPDPSDNLTWPDAMALLKAKRAVRQAAMAGAHRGRPVMVWNGDWVVHPGQEGGGLAAVREIMTWEIAYAPEACRAERVRGLVLISLRDGAGGAHIALGDSNWTWSDLIHARSAVTHGKTLRR